MNVIDSLLAALNTTGIEFVLDAWKDKAPDDYGVLELTGETAAQWADNRMIEQRFRCVVHIYVSGGGFFWINRVQSVLDAQGLHYAMPAREYLYDIHRVHWSWELWLDGPITGADDDG